MEEDGSRQQVEQSKKGSSNTARRKSSLQKQGISVNDEPDRIPTPFPQKDLDDNFLSLQERPDDSKTSIPMAHPGIE